MQGKPIRYNQQHPRSRIPRFSQSRGNYTMPLPVTLFSRKKTGLAQSTTASSARLVLCAIPVISSRARQHTDAATGKRDVSSDYLFLQNSKPLPLRGGLSLFIRPGRQQMICLSSISYYVFHLIVFSIKIFNIYNYPLLGIPKITIFIYLCSCLRND